MKCPYLLKKLSPWPDPNSRGTRYSSAGIYRRLMLHNVTSVGVWRRLMLSNVTISHEISLHLDRWLEAFFGVWSIQNNAKDNLNLTWPQLSCFVILFYGLFQQSKAQSWTDVIWSCKILLPQWWPLKKFRADRFAFYLGKSFERAVKWKKDPLIVHFWRSIWKSEFNRFKIGAKKRNKTNKTVILHIILALYWAMTESFSIGLAWQLRGSIVVLGLLGSWRKIVEESLAAWRPSIAQGWSVSLSCARRKLLAPVVLLIERKKERLGRKR